MCLLLGENKIMCYTCLMTYGVLTNSYHDAVPVSLSHCSAIAIAVILFHFVHRHLAALLHCMFITRSLCSHRSRSLCLRVHLRSAVVLLSLIESKLYTVIFPLFIVCSLCVHGPRSQRCLRSSLFGKYLLLSFI